MTNRLTSQKRRAQNRESQRAFRERKKQHVQALENKLQKLLMRHEEIINLYTKQSMEIARLDQKLDHLALELLMCQTNGNHATDGTVIFPPKESISEASSSSSVGTRSSLNCSDMECWTDNHINAGYGSSVDTQ
jgi:chromosome segregation ATPase